MLPSVTALPTRIHTRRRMCHTALGTHIWAYGLYNAKKYNLREISGHILQRDHEN